MACKGVRDGMNNLKHTYQFGADSFGGHALLDGFSNLAQIWLASIEYYWSKQPAIPSTSGMPV
jgi:hypothetical protein